MNRPKFGYPASMLVLCMGLVAFDVYNFEFIVLPLFFIAQIIGLIIYACMQRFQGAFKKLLLSMMISLGALIIGGAVGGLMNGQNRVDGMQIASGVEEFKLNHNKYPKDLSEIPSLHSKKTEKRLRFRARYVYKATADGNSYFLEIQTFPIGFVKWNRVTHQWDDEVL
ncbi:hypothetical protein [Ralstonia solanacearum]|uniref:hypothetical protein n=2 Tax=Ralstonia solanacearum TaxID=305 RepID=UPI001FFBE230